QERCARSGAVLIFDEIITGFRLGPEGAAGRLGVTPDLLLLGKALGGGMPIAAYGGRRDLMALVAPGGPVYQAGTYAAHPLSIAAAQATLDLLDLDPSLWARLEVTADRLAGGLAEAAIEAHVPLRVQRVGSMWTAVPGAARALGLPHRLQDPRAGRRGEPHAHPAFPLRRGDCLLRHPAAARGDGVRDDVRSRAPPRGPAAHPSAGGRAPRAADGRGDG